VTAREHLKGPERARPGDSRLSEGSHALDGRIEVLSIGRAVSSSFGRRDYLIRRWLALGDVTSIVLALALMAALSNTNDAVTRALWGLPMVPVWLALLAAYGLYNRDIRRISHSTVDDFPWLLHAVLVSCLLSWLYYNLLPIPKLVFIDILVLGGLATALILLFRTITRRVTTRVLGSERVLFVGEPDSIEMLMRKMVAHPEYGLEPTGVISPSGGNGINLDQVLDGFSPERIVLGDTNLSEPALLELIHRCKELSLKVSLLPHLFGAIGPSVEVDDVEGVTVLGINPPVLPRSARYMKRALDVVTSICVLVVTAPLVGLTALAIKLDSPGPVFFKQHRVGKRGRQFELIKFRTMGVGAEGETAALMAESRDSGWLKLESDPRVTRVGRLLRLTSLDELPQCWNILKGEMSLVGPRPLIKSEDSQIGGWARSRLELTPGLTGLWQVLGRTNIPFDEMVKLDYLYVTNWSLWTDVRLILRTFPAVFTRRGAN
jgi:exopolysaccharide biosynthesis polyprenyl glycosylphosphotransferase